MQGCPAGWGECAATETTDSAVVRGSSAGCFVLGGSNANKPELSRLLKETEMACAAAQQGLGINCTLRWARGGSWRLAEHMQAFQCCLPGPPPTTLWC